jgi:hypothetical protein
MDGASGATMRSAGMKLAVMLVVFVLSIFLIEIIWNNVIIKKFPNANIQRLTFWDSLAIAVFVSLLTSSGAAVIAIK